MFEPISQLFLNKVCFVQDEVTVKGMCPRSASVNVCVSGGVSHMADTLQCASDKVPSLSNTEKLSSGTGLLMWWIVGKCPVVAHGM